MNVSILCLTTFYKIFNYNIQKYFNNPCHMVKPTEEGPEAAKLFHVDSRTHRLDKANSHFSQFRKQIMKKRTG